MSNMAGHFHPIQMPASHWRFQTIHSGEQTRLRTLGVTTQDECLTHGLFSYHADFVVYYEGQCFGGTFEW